jgi:alkanesulfonate monooxygenase SsuD/methylene tetrahydromethanopterin reductase-like flavin-dependent oxidoreductase (luciferase family)
MDASGIKTAALSLMPGMARPADSAKGNPMRFSVFQVPASAGADDDRAVLELSVRQALAADEQGFAAFFLPEHHVTGYAPAGADPVAFAAYLAPQMKQAWLGFAVTVVPSWHPVRLVERLNLLDQLTQGRLLVGLGSGVSSIEHAALGIKTDDMVGGMTDEVLATAMQLWAKRAEDPEISFDDGKYYRGTVINRVVPAPYTTPHPNLIRVAARPQAISMAARAGWPVFLFGGDGRVNLLRRLSQYRRELLEAGHDQQTLAFCQRWTTSPALLAVAIGDTEAEARDYVRAEMEAQQRHIVEEQPWAQRAFDLGVTSMPPYARDVTSPRYMSTSTVYGTVDQVEEQLRELEEIGIGNVLVAFNYGANDPGRRLQEEEMQARFAAEILPRFAPVDPPLAALQDTLADRIAIAESREEAVSHPMQRAGA